jgi:carboxymethylenebutenolidase
MFLPVFIIALGAISGTTASAPIDDAAARYGRQPERVTFPSADGHTMLTGYLYRTSGKRTRVPAIVMMHGRSGAYSSRANGVYDASSLSQRHQAWGELLAGQGYVVLMVDGFGPRGYPAGFPRFSYDDRPDELNEVTVRPLDAYGAAAYLRTLPEVSGDHIGLLGWSNGGSATLAAMARDAPGIVSPTPSAGFRAAVAFYPACHLKDRYKDVAYRTYAPVHVFHGTSDEETSPRLCASFVERSKAEGGEIGITLYPGATHSFDSPDSNRQSVEPNAVATDKAISAALAFFEHYLK